MEFVLACIEEGLGKVKRRELVVGQEPFFSEIFPQWVPEAETLKHSVA